MHTLKSLAETVDYFESIFNSQLSLRDDQIVILSKESSSLRVTQNDPFQTYIFKMFGTDFPCICTIAVVGTVLSCDPVVEFVSRIECENAWDMKRDRGDNDI